MIIHELIIESYQTSVHVAPGGVPLPKVPKCQNSNDGTFGTPDRKRWNFWNFWHCGKA